MTIPGCPHVFTVKYVGILWKFGYFDVVESIMRNVLARREAQLNTVSVSRQK